MLVEPSTVETVRTAVETHPNIWLAVGVAVGPVATATLIGWGVTRHLLPYIKDELAASRLHMSEALAKRGNEAAGHPWIGLHPRSVAARRRLPNL